MAGFGGFRPLKRQVEDFSGGLNVFNRFQSRSEYSQLRIAITSTANVLPEGMFNRSDARHANRGGQIGDVRKADGCEASRLDLTLRQSDGPAANRSTGDQDDHVYLLILKSLDNIRDAPVKHLFRLEQISHDRIVRIRYTTNFAVFRQFFQTADWQ